MTKNLVRFVPKINTLNELYAFLVPFWICFDPNTLAGIMHMNHAAAKRIVYSMPGDGMIRRE
jgi:hypothetical protein